MIRQGILDKLWFGLDPFTSLPKNLYNVDLQGWRSIHDYLIETINSEKPSVIIEIGVWKGGSTVSMASRIRELDLDGVVIAVDTWLGAVDHWQTKEWFDDLSFDGGYPSIYKKFCNNVVASGLRDYVVPLPLDSVNAAELILSKGIKADMIHLDAGHEYSSVSSDLEAWWPCLRKGGFFIGDDYDPEGGTFPGVRRAIDDFLLKKGISSLEYSSGKCIVQMP